MKLFSLGLCFFLVYSTHAQKAKIKTNNFTFKYEIYPELAGYEEAKTFTVEIADKKNVPLSYSEGNSTDASLSNIHNPLGLIYGFKWLKSDSHLLFKIKQNSSEQNEKEVYIYEDAAAKVKKHSYKITAQQNYTIQIIDLKSDNKLLKEITIDEPALMFWPGVPSATVGYNDPGSLKVNYEKKQEIEPDFYRKIESALILSALKSRIGKEINQVLHESFERIGYLTYDVKAKDERFVLLDSAQIYLDMGLEEMKKNEKAGLKGNHHLENVRKPFVRAHQIYTQYSKEEYSNWFTEEDLKEEYLFNMITNLYLTSFLISDFETTEKLFSAISTKVKNEEAAFVRGESFSDRLASLKRSPAKKTLDNMMLLRSYELRELRLREIFKERYKY